MKYFLCILLLAALMLTSCSKSGSPTSSNNNSGGVPTTANTMDVTIDGTVRLGLAAQGSKSSSSGLTVTAVVGFEAATGKTVIITLTNITSIGTYDVGVTNFGSCSFSSVAMTYSTKDASGKSLNYSSPAAGTSSVGQLVITEFTATSIKATFNATLSLQSGTGPATVSITNGGLNAAIM